MTARVADPAAAVDDAVRELLATLAGVVRDHPDPSDAHDVLDQVTVALRRARGRVRRAECKESAPDGKSEAPNANRPTTNRPVLLEVLRPAPIRVVIPAPRPLISRPAPPIPRPAADVTRTGECAPTARRDTHVDRPPSTAAPPKETVTMTEHQPAHRGPTNAASSGRRLWPFALLGVVVLAVVVGLVVWGLGRDDGGAGPQYDAPSETGQYATPDELIKALNDRGFECLADGSSKGFTAIGAQTNACWRPDNTESVRVEVYVNRDQAATGIADMKDADLQVVEGGLWAVGAHTSQTANAVLAALK